jgi:phosphonate degradation associated HDIG domain protein
MNFRSIEEIMELFDLWGTDHYDEDVTQLDHALQCAAHARAAGATDSLVAACLLHDIGHLIDLEAGGTVERPISDRHEEVGAASLATLFPPPVTAPIALHVRAKRYLAASEHGYIDALSEGSRSSLERQGGPMDVAEMQAFEQNPGFGDACSLRRWDDLGKVDGVSVETLDTYLELLERLRLRN